MKTRSLKQASLATKQGMVAIIKHAEAVTGEPWPYFKMPLDRIDLDLYGYYAVPEWCFHENLGFHVHLLGEYLPIDKVKTLNEARACALRHKIEHDVIDEQEIYIEKLAQVFMLGMTYAEHKKSTK